MPQSMTRSHKRMMDFLLAPTAADIIVYYSLPLGLLVTAFSEYMAHVN